MVLRKVWVCTAARADAEGKEQEGASRKRGQAAR